MENKSNELQKNDLDFEMTKKLRFYLEKLVKNNGSDLHIKSGTTIRGRIDGELIPFSNDVVSYENGLKLAKELLRSRFSELVEKKNLDITFKLNEEYRFRVNIFFQVDGISAAFRVIPAQVPEISELILPNVIYDMCSISRGLILVAGPTGSGKSTTLAAMINEMNKTTRRHIITLEDPVEFVYEDHQSIINQRMIGQDALSFSDSLRAALREDPDVILLGEMRDVETVKTALYAAETGHLVLSTLHTTDSKETISRILGMFSGSEHERVRMIIASVLQGVISQRLVRCKDGGRMAAVEILIKTPRVESYIMDSRESEILDALKEGKDVYKTQTFDQSLLDIYKKGYISKDEALKNATSKNDLKLMIDYLESNLAKMASNKTNGDSKVRIDENDIVALKKR